VPYQKSKICGKFRQIYTRINMSLSKSSFFAPYESGTIIFITVPCRVSWRMKAGV